MPSLYFVHISPAAEVEIDSEGDDALQDKLSCSFGVKPEVAATPAKRPLPTPVRASVPTGMLLPKRLRREPTRQDPFKRLLVFANPLVQTFET